MAIYAHQKQSDKFYFAPQGIELVVDTDGKPNFSFARMTYIPSRAKGNENWKQTNMVQFTVSMKQVSPQILREIKNILRKRLCSQCRPKLVPIPLSRVQANLVYTSIDADTIEVLKNKYHNTEQDKKEGRWSTKTFTIRPNKHTSEILWDGFEKDKALLTVAYAIWAKGKYTDSVSYKYNGSKELEALFKNLNASRDSTQVTPSETLIVADAFPVSLDLEKWPDLLKEIDLGSTLSPRYGLIDIYCHDFSDNIRSDLIGKIVEFKAHAAGVGFVKTEVEFMKSAPYTVAHALKFEYAVRLDKPFYYRVIEMTEAGEVITGVWQTKIKWSSIIDVSSQKEFVSVIKN
ncbi:hypothetical protein GCM10022397_12070 [Flavivirga jejuensis]